MLVSSTNWNHKGTPEFRLKSTIVRSSMGTHRVVLLEYWFVGDVVEVVPPKHKKSGKPWNRSAPSVTKEINTTTTDEEIGPAEISTTFPGNDDEKSMEETNSTIDEHTEEMGSAEICMTDTTTEVTEESMAEIPQFNQVSYKNY